MSGISIETIELTCAPCPTQYRGTLSDGSAFYFRARWGLATLAIAETYDAALDVSIGSKLGFYREADDDTFGYMEEPAAYELIYGWVSEYASSKLVAEERAAHAQTEAT